MVVGMKRHMRETVFVRARNHLLASLWIGMIRGRRRIGNGLGGPGNSALLAGDVVFVVHVFSNGLWIRCRGEDCYELLTSGGGWGTEATQDEAWPKFETRFGNNTRWRP